MKTTVSIGYLFWARRLHCWTNWRRQSTQKRQCSTRHLSWFWSRHTRNDPTMNLPWSSLSTTSMSYSKTNLLSQSLPCLSPSLRSSWKKSRRPRSKDFYRKQKCNSWPMSPNTRNSALTCRFSCSTFCSTFTLTDRSWPRRHLCLSWH